MARARRTSAEIEALQDLIYEVAQEEQPLTVRGCFYRVMSLGGVAKTELSYRVVQREALKMRREGRIPYHWFRDGTRWRLKPDTWDSMTEALNDTARLYRRSLWRDSDVYLEIWSEKDAITSVINEVTDEWDVPLLIARGYASESFLWQAAQQIKAIGKRSLIYQLGDHDPSGVDAWRHTRERLLGFVDGEVSVYCERLAVTPEQIEELSLPTRPTKTTDSRSGGFAGESVEVDAIPSPTLRAIVRDVIDEHVDHDRLDILRIAEHSERRLLRHIANSSGEWGDAGDEDEDD